MSETTAQSLVPVAQYLRMSKEHQRYSIRNQARAISAYAQEHGFSIAKTYTDPGLSGLTLRERPGLQSLLADVIKPTRIFRHVLVLDVSRWGRFQNLDQAGHYEFICAEAGSPVIYCAEMFENDGTPVMALLKQIKRLQAAEYSRELSGKVLHAQLLQAKIGHKLGGSRRFGFDRVLVDEHDRPIQKLERGETKALNNQRVIYAIGSDQEVKVVRDIFTWYTRDRMSMQRIVQRLTELKIPAGDHAAWTLSQVRRVLSNELVVGVYVFNRTTQPLKSKKRMNPPEALIKTKVVEPIISRVQFDIAARRLRIRRHHVPQEENLAAVARLLRTKGYLTGKLIDECPYAPSQTVLLKQFGSILRVYELVGYKPQGWVRSRKGRPPATNDQILARLRELYERLGYLNEHVINGDPTVPSVSGLQLHFGKLTNAYRLAGLPFGRTELQRLGAERLKARREGMPPRKITTPRWPELASRFSDEDLLECLRRLHKQYGFVTAQIIREDELSPTPALFSVRFGSLLKAYARAGIEFGAERERQELRQDGRRQAHRLEQRS